MTVYMLAVIRPEDQVLPVFYQFVDNDGVTNVQIGCRRIETDVSGDWTPGQPFIQIRRRIREQTPPREFFNELFHDGEA